MCSLLVSKCCGSKTSLDQYGLRRCKFCLLPTSVKLNSKIRRCLSVGLFIMVFMFSITTKEQSTVFVHKYSFCNYSFPVISNPDIELNDSAIIKELLNDSCVLGSVAIVQFRMESANYTSNIAIQNKNIAGIKWHKCKYVTGELNGHATFKSYRDCIACYCHIQNYYLAAIDGKYAEKKTYVTSIKEFKK